MAERVAKYGIESSCWSNRNNIDEQTTNWIRQYIQPEGNCVVPTNVDVTGSGTHYHCVDSGKGKRTVSVIGKTDLADDPNTLMKTSDVIHFKFGLCCPFWTKKSFLEEKSTCSQEKSHSLINIQQLMQLNKRKNDLDIWCVDSSFGKSERAFSKNKIRQWNQNSIEKYSWASAKCLKEYNQFIDLWCWYKSKGRF